MLKLTLNLIGYIFGSMLLSFIQIVLALALLSFNYAIILGVIAAHVVGDLLFLQVFRALYLSRRHKKRFIPKAEFIFFISDKIVIEIVKNLNFKKNQNSAKRHPSEIGRHIVEDGSDEFGAYQHYSVLEPKSRGFVGPRAWNGARDRGARGIENPSFLATFKGPDPYLAPNSPQLKNIPNSLESSDDSSFYSTADFSNSKPKTGDTNTAL